MQYIHIKFFIYNDKMIKAYLNKDGSIAKYNQVEYKEVILDYDVYDDIVKDEKTNEIVLFRNSTQFKNKVLELESKKTLTEDEARELKHLQSLML